MHFNDFFQMFLIVFVKLCEQKWEGSHLKVPTLPRACVIKVLYKNQV